MLSSKEPEGQGQELGPVNAFHFVPKLQLFAFYSDGTLCSSESCFSGTTGAAELAAAIETTAARMTAPPIRVAADGASPNASQTQTGPNIVSVCASTVCAAAGTRGAPRRKQAKPSLIGSRPPASAAATSPSGETSETPLPRQTSAVSPSPCSALREPDSLKTASLRINAKTTRRRCGSSVLWQSRVTPSRNTVSV
jgi:hypothetical protein